MVNSRRKGKTGELDWCSELRDLGFTARRGCQYSGSSDSPDVVSSIESVHWEVKRVEALSVYKAMAQAVADCGDSVPVVAHRRNKCEWLLVLRAKDMKRFAQRIAEATKREKRQRTENKPSETT